MSRIANSIILRIILCFILAAFLFVSHSCHKDRVSTDRPDPLGISGEDYHPSWSPDGTKISFVSDRYGDEDIYIMNPDGSEQTRITDSLAGDFGVSWSPDGKKIAFISNRAGNWEIYTIDTDGSDGKYIA